MEEELSDERFLEAFKQISLKINKKYVRVIL